MVAGGFEEPFRCDWMVLAILPDSSEMVKKVKNNATNFACLL